jgi:transposase
MSRITPKRRARIAELLGQGHSTRAVAAKVGVSQSTVARVRSADPALQPSPLAGRPRLLDKHDERYILRLNATGKCTTGTGIQKLLAEGSGAAVSARTVRRVLGRAGLKARTKRKKPLLRKKHRQARLTFARKYQHWTVEDWMHVIWSDETKINLYESDGKQYCWRADGEPLRDHHVTPTVKHGGGSLMIWGCMTAQGVGYMCKIDDGLDAELYRRILDDEFLSTLEYYGVEVGDIVFQHDNDPKHTARSTKEWLEDREVEVLQWPAQSPDLNPIEHLWFHVKCELNKYKPQPRNKDELWERLQAVWEAITPKKCLKLIETMPRRIQAILKAKGGHTKW